MQHGSFQWMKSLNKSIILNKIRLSQPISRAQIAKDTNLTPPTVSTIVKELLVEGIVLESRLGTSQGGRKPTMLVINHNNFYIIGIDAGPKNITVVLADLSGEIADRASYEIDSTITATQFIQLLKRSAENLINMHSKQTGKIIGIGVAMHGVIEIETGVAIIAPNLDLHNIPIKQELENEFNLTVKVENDARAMALGEAWFGDSKNAKSLLALNIGQGVGAGFIIDSKLYHGAFDLAGEVGHMTIDIHGKKCECGNNGCLQTVASGPAIASRAMASIQNSSILFGLINGNPAKTNGELVYQAALAGDKKCVTILQEAGVSIGVGLTNLIHIVNPEKIVIGGGVSKAEKYLLPSIKKAIQTRALTERAKQTEISISRLGDDATVLGAIALLLVEMFESSQL
ncbi:ROK family transcriptional regulator [Virgibacillus sp. DJP39]|uniref:ROK family transcriptional regulator n=1 Tax=Virgibacillus sp. DJP39 TaxID=3409790 RepID=UPI003BB49D02